MNVIYLIIPRNIMTTTTKTTSSVKSIIDKMSIEEIKAKIEYAHNEIDASLEYSHTHEDISVMNFLAEYGEIINWLIALQNRLDQLQN